MREHLLYIDGAWRGGGAGSAAAVSPASGETFATVAVADPADVDDAVRRRGEPGPRGRAHPRSSGRAGAAGHRRDRAAGARNWPGR